MADFGDEGAHGIENGETEAVVNILCLFGNSGKLNLLDVFLELPVIDESLFPFWNELSFQLLGELHHFELGKTIFEKVERNRRVGM